LTLDNQSFAQIRQIIELLIGEKNRPDRSDEILRSLLRVLLGHIQRGVVADQKKPNSKRQMVLYRAFRGLLETHFRSNLTASGYADLLHVTQHHLNLVVGQISGRTTSDIIRTRNILEAKRHLTFSDRSVSEIAADLHFFDLSYFGKVFKSETGLSPLDFRKAMSEKYRKQTLPS
jgi:AraC family transcriptional regulator, transcriptional activator of pobA